MTECIVMIVIFVNVVALIMLEEFVKKEWYNSDKWYKKFTYDSWDQIKKEPGRVVVLMILMFILLVIVGPYELALITSFFIYKAIGFFISNCFFVSLWFAIFGD